MRAAVLCPGPSLSLYHGGEYDLIIGVNRAATAHICHVWAALDWPMIKWYAKRVKGEPVLLTHRRTRDDLAGKGVWPGLVLVREDFLPESLPTAAASRWTLVAAIGYAVNRGAGAIDLYGCDWSGAEDFDGAKAGENRSDQRWAEERELVLGVIEPYLAVRGVGLRRVL